METEQKIEQETIRELTDSEMDEVSGGFTFGNGFGNNFTGQFNGFVNMGIINGSGV